MIISGHVEVSFDYTSLIFVPHTLEKTWKEIFQKDTFCFEMFHWKNQPRISLLNFRKTSKLCDFLKIFPAQNARLKTWKSVLRTPTFVQKLYFLIYQQQTPHQLGCLFFSWRFHHYCFRAISDPTSMEKLETQLRFSFFNFVEIIWYFNLVYVCLNLQKTFLIIFCRKTMDLDVLCQCFFVSDQIQIHFSRFIPRWVFGRSLQQRLWKVELGLHAFNFFRIFFH